MSRNLAVDSGGTKVLAILYNEDFRILSACRTGSMRPNTTGPGMVRHNIEDLIGRLQLDGVSLDHVTGIMEDTLLERMRERGVTIRALDRCSEAEAGFAAAECFGDVLMALSGTGATMFARFRGRPYVAGGYGSLVSDEGSGYWFSRAALGAAIRAMEGRGEPTILTDLIASHWGYPNDLRKAIFSIYDQDEISPAACVASCAPLVTAAAAQKDAVATKILREAGSLLGIQLVCLARRFGLPSDLPVTISGGAWRRNPILFGEFERTLRNEGMRQPIRIPPFEPIAGLIIRHFYQQNGSFTRLDHERFLSLYSEYRYSID